MHPSAGPPDAFFTAKAQRRQEGLRKQYETCPSWRLGALADHVAPPPGQIVSYL
jgi:hypothetical protein